MKPIFPVYAICIDVKNFSRFEALPGGHGTIMLYNLIGPATSPPRCARGAIGGFIPWDAGPASKVLQRILKGFIFADGLRVPVVFDYEHALPPYLI
jgi:hypothetical protein